MFSIVAYKVNFFLKLLSFIPKIKIYVWKRNYIKNINYLKFPDSSEYFKNRDLAYQQIKNIINDKKEKLSNNNHIYIYDYIGKILVLNIDYIIFKNTFKKVNKLNFKFYLLQNNIIKNIYNKKRETFSFYFRACYYLLKFTIFFLRCSIYSIKLNKIEHPDILYLRKKEYHDLSLFDNFKKSFNKKNINILGTIIFFSNKKKFNNFFYLGSFKNSSAILIKSFFSCILLFFPVLVELYRRKISSKIIYNMLTDLLLCRYIMYLDVKIITGVLVDKPIFSLLKLFKTDNKKICSLNEFFHFPPYPGFEFCNLDLYFSLNDMDCRTHNKLGGKINKFINSPFIRNNLISNSNGVSKDLLRLTKKYKKVILVLTSQVPESHYFNQSEDINDFLYKIYNESINFNELLFIIKEKKNELIHLDNEIYNKLKKSNNIYIINSKVPRNLEYNQFEDLLSIADLSISSVFVSTTNWQTISKKIPTISYSRYKLDTFMNEFKYLLVNETKLNEAIKYWLKIDKGNFEKFLHNFKNYTNISNEDGLKFIAKNIQKIID